MTVEVDTIFFAFNLALLVTGVAAGVLLGWTLHGLRGEREATREREKAAEARDAAAIVATDAWLWACETFPENRDARSAACEGYNAGAERRKPKGNGP
jgi:hypothetical protein